MSRPIPATKPKTARTVRNGLKCPLCDEIGVIVVVVVDTAAGVGIVVVGFSVVVGFGAVVAGLGAVVVGGGAVVVVVDDDEVVVVDSVVDEVLDVTGSWARAGPPASSARSPAKAAAARIRRAWEATARV